MLRDWRFVSSHPQNLIIGETSFGVKTKAYLNRERRILVFFSTIMPKNIGEALDEDSQVTAMEEELSQFAKNKVWNLVLLLKNQSLIGTKWVLKKQAQ